MAVLVEREHLGMRRMERKAWLSQWREHLEMGRMENDWSPLNAAERKHWPLPWNFRDCESKGQGHHWWDVLPLWAPQMRQQRDRSSQWLVNIAFKIKRTLLLFSRSSTDIRTLHRCPCLPQCPGTVPGGGFPQHHAHSLHCTPI